MPFSRIPDAIIPPLAAAPLDAVPAGVPAYGVYDTFMQAEAGLDGGGSSYVSYRTGASYHEAAASILTKALLGATLKRRLRDERAAAEALAAGEPEVRA